MNRPLCVLAPLRESSFQCSSLRSEGHEWESTDGRTTLYFCGPSRARHLLMFPARHAVISADRQKRLFERAPGSSPPTPLTETATLGKLRHWRHRALDRFQPPLLLIDPWQAGKQPQRIRVPRVVENLLHRALFDDFARVHHDHVVGQ